jgi:hypothetical protein
MRHVKMPNQQQIRRKMLTQDWRQLGHRFANLEMAANFPPQL